MSKSKKLTKVIIIILVVVLVAAIPVSVYAWMAKLRSRIFIIVGDVEISAKGWYDKVNTDAVNIEYDNELVSDENLIDDLASHEMIAFKFEVTNHTERDATVSISFNDISSFIYENFIEYHSQKQSNTTISAPLADKIKVSAESNTAKLVFIFDNLYYQIGDVKEEIVLDDNFLWQYMDSNNFITKVPLPKKVGNTTTPVYIYFTMKNSQSNLSIDGYKNLICGYVEDIVEIDETVTQITHVGSGQERCANMLGYFWNALTDQKDIDIINDYLKYFVDQELAAIRSDDFGDSTLELTIKHFIFTGENVPEVFE